MTYLSQKYGWCNNSIQTAGLFCVHANNQCFIIDEGTVESRIQNLCVEVTLVNQRVSW